MSFFIFNFMEILTSHVNMNILYFKLDNLGLF